MTLCLSECRSDKIKLKDIEVLTLESGKWTTGRRSAGVPQLKCVSGLCNAFQPSVVHCFNRGTDGLDVQWECKAVMSGSLKFGKICVTCEGYDYADDDYVLRGSCGLEYTIESDSHSDYNSNSARNTTYDILVVIAIIVIVIIIIAIILYNSEASEENSETPLRTSYRSSYGGCSSSIRPSYGFGRANRSTRISSAFGGTKRR